LQTPFTRYTHVLRPRLRRKTPIKPDLSPYLSAAVNILSVRHFVASRARGWRVWIQRESWWRQ
jgi:hypothetical protein